MKKEEEKVYCIFNQTKDKIDERIGKAFEIFLKNYKVTKEKLEKNQELH